LLAYDQRRIDLLAAKSDLKEERIKGKAEGLAEEKISTAKNLLSMGVLSIEQIAEATDLTIDQITLLKGV